jgi:putative peptidoglycan lipid II flippase
VFTKHLRYLALSLVSGAVGFGVLLLLGGLSADGFAQSGRGEAFLSILIIGGVMAVVYGGLLTLFRTPELASVAGTLRRRLGRKRAE